MVPPWCPKLGLHHFFEFERKKSNDENCWNFSFRVPWGNHRACQIKNFGSVRTDKKADKNEFFLNSSSYTSRVSALLEPRKSCQTRLCWIRRCCDMQSAISSPAAWIPTAHVTRVVMTCRCRVADRMYTQRVCCTWPSAMPGQHLRVQGQAHCRLFPEKNSCDMQVPSWRHISCHTDKNRYYTWS